MPGPEHRITIKDIAKETGVHYSTVSLALRNDPRVKEEKRVRIQAAAKRLGYRMDPLVSRLMEIRRGAKVSDFQGCLSLLLQGSSLERVEHIYRPQIKGIHEQATRRGYKIEKFFLSTKEKSLHRYCNILRARNITGLLILADHRRTMHNALLPDMDYSPYSTVIVGHTNGLCGLENVDCDYYETMKSALSFLQKTGARRIGFVATKKVLHFTNYRYVGAYHEEIRRQKGMKALAVLEFEDFLSGNLKANRQHQSLSPFKSWLQKEKPDVVLCTISTLRFMISAFKEFKLKVGKDIGLACLNINPDFTKKGITGMHFQHEEVGIEAVNRVLDLMKNHRTGYPDIPKRLLLEGKWVFGNSHTFSKNESQ